MSYFYFCKFEGVSVGLRELAVQTLTLPSSWPILSQNADLDDLDPTGTRISWFLKVQASVDNHKPRILAKFKRVSVAAVADKTRPYGCIDSTPSAPG